MIPDMAGSTDHGCCLESVLETNSDLEDAYRTDDRARELLGIASHMNGVITRCGLHACGVVVTDRPLVEYGPLMKMNQHVVPQYDTRSLERIGLCKVDILGFEALSIMQRTIEAIGEGLNLKAIPLDDKPTYQMLAEGDTKGVSQLESAGMRDLLKRLKPDRFEDLVAILAMYRPGPINAGMLEDYIARKQGEARAEYIHPLAEPILRETHGLIVYQEQMMMLAQQLAGFTLAMGDLMRRALAKRVTLVVDAFREEFLKKASGIINQVNAMIAFEELEKNAGHAFCKAHAACYALLSYRMAYLKCHWPSQFDEAGGGAC